MQTPSSTPSASSPRFRADAGFGIPGPLPPCHLDPAAKLIRPLLLPEMPNELPVMQATVRQLSAEAAAAERAGFWDAAAAAAYRRRLQRLKRLRQILDRYNWQARQSQERRSRAQRLFWELRAIAEEERKGRRLMWVANNEFNRIAAPAPWYDN